MSVLYSFFFFHFKGSLQLISFKQPLEPSMWTTDKYSQTKVEAICSIVYQQRTLSLQINILPLTENGPLKGVVQKKEREKTTLLIQKEQFVLGLVPLRSTHEPNSLIFYTSKLKRRLFMSKLGGVRPHHFLEMFKKE